jgi:hypothetical protein
VIAHIILFKPRPDLTAPQRQSVIDALSSAARGAPTVRRCRVGRRATHGVPGYEQTMLEGYEYAAILEFDDLDGLRNYLRHPAHAAIGAQFASAAAAALAYDYEMVDVADAGQLLP